MSSESGDAAGTGAQPVSLAGLALARGTFSATVTGIGPGEVLPAIDLVVDGAAVGQARLAHDGAGTAGLTARLPREALSDGNVIVVFRDRATGGILARYPLGAGRVPEGDLAAEIGMLRAEFEALKRAFMAEALHDRITRAERPVIVAEAVAAVMAELEERAEAPAVDAISPGD